MKYLFLTFICLLLINNKIFAQDSTRITPGIFSKSLAKQFSQTRTLKIQYGLLGSRDFDTEFLGNNLDKGHIKNTQDLRLNINLPIMQTGKWELTYSGNYNYKNYNFDYAENQNFEKHLHYFSSAIRFTYFSTFLNKTVIYNTNLIANASDKIFGRVTGLISVTMVLFKKTNSNMTIGLVGFIDPTSTIPILPTFSYSQYIFNDKWHIDMFLPAHIMLRMQLGNAERISIGTQLESTSFYLNNNEILTYANNFEFRQTALKSGITYEYLSKNNIVLTAKVGLMNVLQSRVSVKGESFNNDNYLIDYKSEATVYFNLGISFSPF